MGFLKKQWVFGFRGIGQNNAFRAFWLYHFGGSKSLIFRHFGAVDIENAVYYPHFVGTSEQFCPQAFPHFGGDILYIAIGYSFNLRLDRSSTQKKKYIYSAALCLRRCER